MARKDVGASRSREWLPDAVSLASVSGPDVTRWSDDEDCVWVTYSGDVEALACAGVVRLELLQPGRRGKPRVDTDGDRIYVRPMNNRWTRVSITFIDKPLERAMRLPGLGIVPLLDRFRRRPHEHLTPLRRGFFAVLSGC
jgi:hypothetical protein